MKENLEVIVTVIKVLGGMLVLAAIFVIVLGGLSLGVQTLWKIIPFGITGFILGLIILGITFYFSREYYPKRKLSLGFDSYNKLAYFEQFGYLYGGLTILASIIWFFLPSGIVRALPSYLNGFGFSVVAVLLSYGVGYCFALTILSFRKDVLAFFLYLAGSILGLVFINFPIWSFTETVPVDYYILGKALFVFIIFLQIVYIVLFHIFPCIQKSKQELSKETKNQK